MIKFFDKLVYFVLFLFLCSITSHQTWIGFDALFCKIIFILFFLLIIIKILKEKKFLMNGYIKWFVLFFSYLALSCLWSSNIRDASTYFSSYFLRIFVLIIGITAIYKDSNDIDKILKLFLLSTIYMIIVLIIKTPSNDWGTYRIGQALGLWKNTVGLYLAYATLIICYFFYKEKKKKKRFLYILLLCFYTAFIMISGCRKALLMLVIGVLIYIFLKREKRLTKNLIIKRTIIILMIPVAISMLYNLMMKNEFLYNVIGERIESGINVYLNDANEQSLDERGYYINEAKKLFYKYPIFGYGSNGFVSYLRQIGYSHVAYCHNNFFEMLCTLGILGFIIYYYMHVKLLISLFKLINDNTTDNTMYCMGVAFVCLITFFGWWSVYYFEIIPNLLFFIIYLSCKKKSHIGGKL